MTSQLRITFPPKYHTDNGSSGTLQVHATENAIKTLSKCSPGSGNGAKTRIIGWRKNSLAVGIKGCPTDLFLAQSVKFGQGDWYKVNNVLDPNFELVYNVRETNKITKESRIEWLIESVTSHQTANRILTENHSAKEDEQKFAGEYGSGKEDQTQESKKQSHSVRKWLRRFWNFVKCPCTGLPKRNNKVADIFYQVDDTEE